MIPEKQVRCTGMICGYGKILPELLPPLRARSLPQKQKEKPCAS